MRTILSLIIITLFTFCMLIPDAQAKRFGGGRSFGVQRSVSSFSRAAPTATPFSSAANQSTRNRWLGPLAGLAAGGLLASLFMGHGVGTGIMSWLLIAGIAMFLLNMFRQRQPAAARNQFYDAPRESAYGNSSSFHPATYNQSAYPQGFDPDNFLREAKVLFMRLQAAYDQKNLMDIRTFTTPEVFAEIQLQFQERGEAENITEVKTLEAEVLQAHHESNALVATVRFSGMIAEDKQAVAPFKEIWNFREDYSGSKWLVAGVQQE